MTSGKRQQNSTLARRLLQDGVRLSVDGPWLYNPLRIRQIGRQSDGSAFDLGSGTTEYIVNCNTKYYPVIFQFLISASNCPG